MDLQSLNGSLVADGIQWKPTIGFGKGLRLLAHLKVSEKSQMREGLRTTRRQKSSCLPPKTIKGLQHQFLMQSSLTAAHLCLPNIVEEIKLNIRWGKSTYYSLPAEKPVTKKSVTMELGINQPS